jgi:hypothetical protein
MSVVRGKLHDYVVVDLSTARTDEPLQVAGDTITVQSIDGELYAKINDTNEPAIALHTIRYVDFRPSSFRRIYLTNTAQAGKSAILRIGKEASFLINPTRSGVVGVLDASEARINPATKEQLPSTLTASGNLKVSLQETTIKQPVDIQDHWQENVVIAPSAARTASGNTADIDVGRILKAEICIDVTAVSGTTPTLDVYVEGQDQLSGKYKVLFSQTGINAVGTFWTPNPLDIAFKYVRARWVIGGTSPQFVFSIGLEGKS